MERIPNRPENLTKMLPPEIESMSGIAAKLYDTFTKDTRDNINSKQAFILGYLHGREKLMIEMGLFDDEDDDSKIYDYLAKNQHKFKN